MTLDKNYGKDKNIVIKKTGPEL